jgi:hypothetical protein
MVKSFIEIEPIREYDSLDEEIRDLENRSDKVGDPEFVFKYKTEGGEVTFKVGDACRVKSRSESGELQWDSDYTINAFYVDRNYNRNVLLVETKTKKPNGVYEVTKLPKEKFLNFAFSGLTERKWTVARETRPTDN